MKRTFWFVLTMLLSVFLIGCTNFGDQDQSSKEGQPQETQQQTDASDGAYEEAKAIVYRNTQYDFSFSLPKSWQGYSIVMGKWEGNAFEGQQAGKTIETGPIISIRHPEWTSQNPRQDIPIMIFTAAQWNLLQQDKFHIGAAPINPRELNRNDSYVLALPARYNFAFPTGYEEVENILQSNPLQVNK